MNIYKVFPVKQVNNYDRVIEFVCYAENEEQAKNLNPDKYLSIRESWISVSKTHDLYINWKDNKQENFYEWVSSPDNLKVIKLGTSDIPYPCIISVSTEKG
jgi:hypothetical protein